MAVPNTNTFSLKDVTTGIYGDTNSSRNLLSCFADSDTAQFDSFYGSKTMNPKTLSGFRNYGHNYYYLYNYIPYAAYGIAPAFEYAFPSLSDICPIGWGIPTEDDVALLIQFCGGYSQAGAKLKETGTVHWNAPNTGANNYSGFTSISSGIYNPNTSSIEALGLLASYWCSPIPYWDGDNYLDAPFFELFYNGTNVVTGHRPSAYGHAVRCIKKDGSASNFPVDGDGHVYSSVFIGTQRWLTQDIHTSRFIDGTLINPQYYKRYYKQFFA